MDYFPKTVLLFRTVRISNTPIVFVALMAVVSQRSCLSPFPSPAQLKATELAVCVTVRVCRQLTTFIRIMRAQTLRRGPDLLSRSTHLLYCTHKHMAKSPPPLRSHEINRLYILEQKCKNSVSLNGNEENLPVGVEKYMLCVQYFSLRIF